MASIVPIYALEVVETRELKYRDFFLPDMGIAKEQRGHRTVFCIPGRGRMFPHSGQKFGSPPKHDISVEGQSVSAKQDWRWRWRWIPFPRPTRFYSLTLHAISMLPEIECSPLLMSDKHESIVGHTWKWTETCHLRLNVSNGRHNVNKYYNILRLGEGTTHVFFWWGEKGVN